MGFFSAIWNWFSVRTGSASKNSTATDIGTLIFIPFSVAHAYVAAHRINGWPLLGGAGMRCWFIWFSHRWRTWKVCRESLSIQCFTERSIVWQACTIRGRCTSFGSCWRTIWYSRYYRIMDIYRCSVALFSRNVFLVDTGRLSGYRDPGWPFYWIRCRGGALMRFLQDDWPRTLLLEHRSCNLRPFPPLKSEGCAKFTGGMFIFLVSNDLIWRRVSSLLTIVLVRLKCSKDPDDV